MSYLIEFPLEEQSTDIHEYIAVSLQKGRLKLSTNRAVYSFEDLYTNFKRAFKRTDLNKLPGNEVLLLGFGLGSIAYMLDQKYPGRFAYTGVEIDETIIDFASRYTLLSIDAPVEIICADAIAFLQQDNRKFDLIAMDVFIEDVVPREMLQFDFLRLLRDSLQPGGLLLFNMLAYSKRDKRYARNFYEKRFSKVFTEAEMLDVGGNFMLVNDKGYLI